VTPLEALTCDRAAAPAAKKPAAQVASTTEATGKRQARRRKKAKRRQIRRSSVIGQCSLAGFDGSDWGEGGRIVTLADGHYSSSSGADAARTPRRHPTPPVLSRSPTGCVSPDP